MKEEDQLAKTLARKALQNAGPQSKDLERFCWMAVHEFHHGVMPVEYDIREIDEALYLAVLKYAKS